MGSLIFKDNTLSKCKCYKCNDNFFPFENEKRSYGLYCHKHNFKKTKRGTICQDCGLFMIHENDDKLLQCYHIINEKKFYFF